MNDRERTETSMSELGRNTVRWILAHLQGGAFRFRWQTRVWYDPDDKFHGVTLFGY